MFEAEKLPGQILRHIIAKEQQPQEEPSYSK